jgi:EF-P beta-lysylation protein EpmB
MRDAFRCIDELCQYLEIEASDVVSSSAEKSFPLFAPRPYVNRIRRGDLNDPLLRQILPHIDETVEVDGFVSDPLGESDASLQSGMLQKYPGRVLLVTTGACAIHCRYCFRRHFPYGDVPHSVSDWQPALDAIREDPTIEEVILSGGDPLTLVDDTIESLVARIETIDHVNRIRIHTRLPIMIPDRVTSRLTTLLANTRLLPIVVVHANHEAEIDDDVITAFNRLRMAGIPLLNQSVLLRGINDSVKTMENLCRRLINVGVMPYYMHQLDRVDGAAQFEVPVEVGINIVEKLRGRLPGYAIPRFVQEVAGDDSKRSITNPKPTVAP